MNIQQQAIQVGIFADEKTLEAALEQVPAALMAAVEVDAVCRLESVHELAEIARRRLEHQVDVVRHQAEHVQANLVKLDAVGQAVEETVAVAVVDENVPPIVPANGNVIDCALILNAKRPGHAVRLPPEHPLGNPYFIF